VQIVYILEFKRSTDRDEGFLEVKEAEVNEQHKSIISALKAAAPKWKFEQINFVVDNRGSVVESDSEASTPSSKSLMYTTDVQDRKKRQAFRRSCDTGMQSAQSGDCVLPPAGARRYEANHRGIEGEHRAQCARVRR